jgi:hypothetical protein
VIDSVEVEQKATRKRRSSKLFDSRFNPRYNDARLYGRDSPSSGKLRAA